MTTVASSPTNRTSAPPKSTRKRKRAQTAAEATPVLTPEQIGNLTDDTLETIRGLAGEARSYVDQLSTLFAVVDAELEESLLGGSGPGGAERRLTFAKAIYGVVRDLECIVNTCDRDEEVGPATTGEPS